MHRHAEPDAGIHRQGDDKPHDLASCGLHRPVHDASRLEFIELPDMASEKPSRAA